MNPHLQRALLLVQQDRFDLAQQELHQTLAHDPNDAMAHAVLAICLVNQTKYAEASQEAETAIGLAPDEAFVFYANSLVLERRRHYPEAQQSIEQAISLDPYNAAYFGQLADVHFSQRRWSESLEAAEQGLALDPEDVHCTNARAMSLVKLGKRTDASEAIATALKRNPEDEVSHANMGWTLLEQGESEKAMEHFREALRLNPELDWARAGIIEAMKARYFLYRLILNWFLWMSKLTRANQWVVLIGAYVGFQVLLGLKNNNPEWGLWLMPFIIAYVAFALMTWMSSSLFNLALRLNRFGRLALSREQIITSNWVGLCVLAALMCVTGYFVAEGEIVREGMLMGALGIVFLVPPLANYYHCQPGQPRTLILLVTIGMASVGFFLAAPMMIYDIAPEWLLALLAQPFRLASKLFVFAALGTQIAVNALVQMDPRK